MLAAFCRVVGDGVAPAAAKSFVKEPESQENEAAGDNRRGDVGADARVTAGAGQLRCSDGSGDSQSQDAQGKSQLGGFGFHELVENGPMWQ